MKDRASKACRKADGNETENHAIFARFGDKDRNEHAVKTNAERTDNGERQNVAEHHTNKRTARPTKRRNAERAVGEERIERNGKSDRNAEDLVGHGKAEEKTLPEGNTRF